MSLRMKFKLRCPVEPLNWIPRHLLFCSDWNPTSSGSSFLGQMCSNCKTQQYRNLELASGAAVRLVYTVAWLRNCCSAGYYHCIRFDGDVRHVLACAEQVVVGVGNGARRAAGSLFRHTEKDRNRESKEKREAEEWECFQALSLEVFPCNATTYLSSWRSEPVNHKVMWWSEGGCCFSATSSSRGKG